jgi:glycerol transport system permease protein
MYRLDNAQQGEKYNTIFSRTTPAQRRKRNARSRFRARFLLGLYLFLMILPIYWLINMSLQTNSEILGSMTLWPKNLTFDNYIGIFTNSSWYMGYVNSML